jgi:hypothetical protein
MAAPQPGPSTSSSSGWPDFDDFAATLEHSSDVQAVHDDPFGDDLLDDLNREASMSASITSTGAQAEDPMLTTVNLASTPAMQHPLTAGTSTSTATSTMATNYDNSHSHHYEQKTVIPGGPSPVYSHPGRSSGAAATATASSVSSSSSYPNSGLDTSFAASYDEDAESPPGSLDRIPEPPVPIVAGASAHEAVHLSRDAWPEPALRRQVLYKHGGTGLAFVQNWKKYVMFISHVC